MVRFVISITTLPDRIKYINSVILQTNSDIDKLYICLPYGEVNKKYIPKNIEKVKVVRCKDYGPITKILGVLEEEKDPDTLILTLDDDVLVKKNITKIFKNKAKKYPKSALSFSGWCYGHSPFNYQIVINNSSDISVDWIQGVHGILYRSSFINKKEFLNFEKKKALLFKNDDHKMAAYLESKGIKRISLNENPVHYFQNYAPASCINAISGDSFNKSVKFWCDVKEISEYFKKKGYYYRSYDYSTSVIFIFALFLLLSLTLITLALLIGYKYNILNIGYISLVIIMTLVLIYFFFNYKYKKDYILEVVN